MIRKIRVKALLILGAFFITTFIGCSLINKNDEIKEQNGTEQQSIDKNKSDEVVQDKELTEEIKNKQGVLNATVDVHDDIVIGVIVLKKETKDEAGKRIIEEYSEKLKKRYGDKKITVQKIQEGKNVESINID
jgi:hypothetical protein